MSKFDNVSNDDYEIQLELENPQDLEVLKMSMLPSVRDKYFRGISNLHSEDNIGIVKDLCSLRRDYATQIFGKNSFFEMQKEKNLLHIPGGLQGKLAQIRKLIRGESKKELGFIYQLTGNNPIRYYDVAFLKEKLKAILLSQDSNNIQMLTCFSL